MHHLDLKLLKIAQQDLDRAIEKLKQTADWNTLAPICDVAHAHGLLNGIIRQNERSE